MAKAPVNGIHIHYLSKGQGADVVLIHGITSSLALWYAKMFPALAGEFRVTAYDLRGHGLSSMTPTGYTSRDMAEDLRGLMDHAGIQKARFVGHSFGGAVALHFALLYPERAEGIALLDTGVASLRHLRNIENWPGWQLFAPQMARHGISNERFTTLDQQQDVTDIIRRSFEIPIQFGFRQGESRATPRFRKLLDETQMGSEFREIAGMTEERLCEISTPVLALYGVNSPWSTIALGLARLLPRCRPEPIQGAGHFYVLQDPSLAYNRIVEFLRDPDALQTLAGQAAASAEPR